MHRPVLTALATTLLACGRAPTTAAPAPTSSPLPAPTGPLPIGVETRRIADTVVRVWYPAARPGPAAPYARADEELGPRLAALLGLGPDVLPDPGRVATHASAGAPAADGRWPVVLFLHGLAGYPAQNTVEVEDLVSHGAIVVAVAMPGEAASIPLPEGGSLAIDPALVGEVYADSEVAGPHFVAMMTAGDRAARDAARAAFVAASQGGAAHGRAWLARARAVVDGLAALPGDDRLAAHLDLGRLGVLGMSFGGGVALPLCEALPACAGSVNLDGFVAGDFVGQPFRRPHLVLESESGPGANAWVVEQRDATAWLVHLRGVQHLGLTDGIVVGLPAELVGTMPAARRVELTRGFVGAFFARVLRGGAAPWLDAPPAAADVVITRAPS